MLSAQGIMQVGTAKVVATSGRGHSPEELAAMALDKILFVSDQAPPAIRDQAAAFRAQIGFILVHYMQQAQQSRDTTVIGALERAGFKDAAKLVEAL